MITIPWKAWYGDEDLNLDFPPTWDAKAYWPRDAPDIGDEGITAALDHPIESPLLEEMARGKKTVAIAVDDISRPTPAARIMEAVMQRLELAGIDLDNVHVVLGVGMHRQMIKDDIIKKIGKGAVERLDVFNNYPYDNLVDMGVSDRGTPIKLNRYFAEADLKIGIGSCTPHGGPGFGGGAKVAFPGVASYETVVSMHRPDRFRTGLLNVDNNELRADIEDMAAKVGLDCVLDVVPNAHRGIAGVFFGNFIKAHRAGVIFARSIYATKVPLLPVDIAICNAYPKDTDFLQAGMAMNILSSSRLDMISKFLPTIVKKNGAIVIITASPEGRGFHALYSPGMIYARSSGHWRDNHPQWRGRPIVHFSPGVTPRDARNEATFATWDAVVEYLSQRYHSPKVAVFPCGALQLAERSVR